MKDEQIDAVTGEVTDAEPQAERAMDGNIVPATAISGGTFLDLLEDGQFGADAYMQLVSLGAEMTDIANATGNKVKGRITLTIDLSKEGEAFTVQGKVAVKKPEMPRPKSIMWTDDRNQFCRFPPNQTQMFGSRPIRRV